MENQYIGEKPKNYYRRRLAAIFVFAIFFIFLGRNLTFIPKVNLYDATPDRLKSDVQKIIKNKPGFYSVYYKDLKTGASFGINENQIETAASVNKMPIVATLYYLGNRGKLNLDQRITINKEDVQDYGTGSIRYQKLPVTYSLRDLARLSLQESDNTAAHVLGVRIGTDVIQNMVDSWKMESTDMEDNKTTTYDMSILFHRIYKGQIANPSLTRELLGFMSNTDFEDRLNRNLPKGISVYHKAGDGDGFVHDVGVVEYDGKAYFLGVMTSDIGDTQEKTKATIGEISKKTYDSIAQK